MDSFTDYVTTVMELSHLFNIFTVPGVGLMPTETPDKDHVSRALHEAKKSTASVGRFTDRLPKEKAAKGLGKKRKVRCFREFF